MAEMLNNLREIWRRTSLVQRAVLLAVLLGCGGAAAMLIGWARQPSMAMLYSGLSTEEAAAIVERIRDEGVPYELKAGGTAVYVPEQKVYPMRLLLAGQGLPTGDQAGYRILDDEKIGASPFIQRVNYNRAIEGELSKTIQTLQGVASARVHVVRPEATLFSGQEKEASASVVLKLHAGRRLGPGSVSAIVHLVAGAVEGLKPEKVVVVDSANNLLSAGGEDDVAKKAGSFLDYKSQVEQYLAGKAEDMLAAALGPNRASVRVHAVIETSTMEETVETYDPANRVVAKEETKNRSISGAADTTGGTPSKETEKSSTTEYLASLTRRRQESLPGKIQSITVAALVDLSPAEQAGGKEGAAPEKVMTVEGVTEIIQKALGLPDATGITVQETSFYHPAPAEAAEASDGWFTKDFMLEMGRRLSLAVLVVGALITLKVLGGSRKAAASAAAALEGEAAGQNLLPAGAGADAEQLRAKITNALQSNPEEVKRLFLSWVDSDKGA